MRGMIGRTAIVRTAWGRFADSRVFREIDSSRRRREMLPRDINVVIRRFRSKPGNI